MQQIDERLILSASDVVSFLECAHLTHLDLGVATGGLVLEATRTDAGDLVAAKGDEHERAYLDALVRSGKEVVTIPEARGGLDVLRGSALETLDAMRAGAEVIYQGVLFDGARRLGYADFLERVERSSPLGDWSYEVADTKLARRVKPYFLIQLCFYSELLAVAQGLEPVSMHVILGTRARESFHLAEFSAYYRSVSRHLDELLAAGMDGTYPDPVDHCGLCRWSDHCDARREADDHLSLVAGMRRSQTARLAAAGIPTVDRLASASPSERPSRIGCGAFETLHRQAALQVEQRTTGTHEYELLEPQADRGFARLPEPSEGDLFFDMEGDPFFDEGLEYLFGVTSIEGGEPRFRAFRATDRAEEKHAFERFVDFVTDRIERDPGLHVYHYAPYEPTALKRLMGMHATREDEIDDLLRGERFVDLYAVVRQGLRISQPSYSIKKVEAFYMDERETSVTDGGDSIIEFERFLETGDRSLLDAIELYNEDDCRSTWLLHRWLLERRTEAIERFGADIAWKPPPEPRGRNEEALAELDALRGDLVAGVPDDPDERTADQRSRWLMAQLLDYHRREAKPVWWAYFERLKMSEEDLTDPDTETLGGLSDAGVEPRPVPRPGRSLIHTLKFPEQDHKVGPGKFVDPATGKGVTVASLDEAAGRLEVQRAANRLDDPLPRALIPGDPYNTNAQRGALRRLAEDVSTRGLDAEGRYRALRDVLRREPPRTSARPPGAPLQAGAFDLAEAKHIVAGLDESYLFVQGPPGSGKTFSGAHLILHLLARGKRVGVASGSHRAIHKLLEEVERFADEAGSSFRGLKKHSGADTRYESIRGFVENSDVIADFLDPHVDLVAGTAWLFACGEMDSTLDYLFIDEAGQISLPDTLAMGTAARNLVLLGDPLQLAQVSQAVHPPGAGQSVLEHLLADDATIPRERGVFIDETRRMHPDVCRFISEVVYEGRLASSAGCERQLIEAPGELTGTGVRWIPVQHSGNTRRSAEEAEAVARAVEGLMGSDYTDKDGKTAPLAAGDIMVVAPYNAQVRCLRERLPAGVQVGTVDKFQGQEAAIVFFSMATSSGEEIPRNLEFLFSRNRLNVAVSRARCLAVLVASPELLRIRCRSAEQMRLVNALCRLVEMADERSPRMEGRVVVPHASRD